MDVAEGIVVGNIHALTANLGPGADGQVQSPPDCSWGYLRPRMESTGAARDAFASAVPPEVVV